MFFPSNGKSIPPGMSEAEYRKDAPNEKPYDCTQCGGIRLHAVVVHLERVYLTCVICDLTSQVV